MIERFVELIQPILKYLPLLAQKKTFLYTVGALCIIGMLSRWLVRSEYKGMIKRARDMSSPRNRALRQIKIKFENCRQLTGQVKNTEAMVNSFIHSYRTLGFTLNGICRITDMCALGCMAIGGASGAVSYVYGGGKTTAAAYILIGCALAFGLEIFDKWTDIRYLHKVLIDTITDFLENVVENPMASIVRQEAENSLDGDNLETDCDSMPEDNLPPQQEVASTKEKERLIEEMLSEFLQ